MVKIMKTLLLLSIMVLGAAMAGCSSNSTHAPSTPVPSTPAPPPVQPSEGENLAPDFELQSLDGKPVALSSLRGKPVMLNFWATWCGPCRAEMPYIQQVFEDKEWTDRGLVILAVNVGDSSSKVREFMKNNGLSFRALLDTDASVARDYNVTAIPATFFIDKNGIMKDVRIGAFPSKEEIDWRLLNSIMEVE